jgi:O-antigen/teichoic acid export membrane protein
MLTDNGNLKYLNIIALSGMVLNIVLNLILIPKYFSLGAAYASMITQFTSAGLQIILAHKVFNFKFQKLLALKYVIHISATFYLFYALSNFESNWIIKGLIGCSISLFIALGLKIIRPFELVRLLKSEQQ